MTRRTAIERREEIIGAAVQVILAKGVAAATTRDVTTALGVGAGLLSHYFTWGDLRGLAFERIVRADIAESLTARVADDPAVVLADFVGSAFAAGDDGVWRTWIEATDLASSDPALAAKVAACTEEWRAAFDDLLMRGVATGAWSCRDTAAASWRCLALLVGLFGLMSIPGARLSREEATTLFAHAVARECEPVVRSASRRQK